jgi:hypothetical protein
MIRGAPGFSPSSQAEDSLETVGNLRLWRSVFILSFSIKSSSYKERTEAFLNVSANQNNNHSWYASDDGFDRIRSATANVE